MATYFHVYEHGTDKHVDTISTNKTGRMKDRLEMGIMQRVDLDRFLVVESEEPDPARARMQEG